MTAQESVNEAVGWAIKENLLDGFFKLQKEEVLAMSLTEYDEEAVMRSMREEGREEGRNEGIREKALSDATALLKENISPEIIARCVKLPLEQVIQLQTKLEV